MQASTAVLPHSSASEETCSCAKQLLQHGETDALGTGAEEMDAGLTGAEEPEYAGAEPGPHAAPLDDAATAAAEDPQPPAAALEGMALTTKELD